MHSGWVIDSSGEAIPTIGIVLDGLSVSVAFRSAKDAAFAERKATMRQLLIRRS
jgi:hypothetical protein